jgi:GntR family transcriptional repressor for pyruvate dehydrogenase complex
MPTVFEPVLRQSLSDDLAHRIKQLIQVEGHQPGDRLPAITEMARRFGVGHPTLREALRKLETLGMVNIRHGSGVYVGRDHNTLMVSNPIFDGAVSPKLLIDLIEARIPIELQSVALAARHASDQHLDEMTQLLDSAGRNLDDDVFLTSANMAFHRQIALASANTVLFQLLEVLSSLFQQEQRLILNIYGSRKRDHTEHVKILEALQNKDEVLAVERMRAHLEGVREVLLQHDPHNSPVG